MEVDYVYCDHCGCEAFDVYVGFARTTADREWVYCPECGKETSNFDTGDL